MKLLTVAETAEILSVSKTVVYELFGRGELPYVVAANSKGYRIDSDDLAEFIRSRKVQKCRTNGSATKIQRSELRHIRL